MGLATTGGRLGPATTENRTEENASSQSANEGKKEESDAAENPLITSTWFPTSAPPPHVPNHEAKMELCIGRGWKGMGRLRVVRMTLGGRAFRWSKRVRVCRGEPGESCSM